MDIFPIRHSFAADTPKGLIVSVIKKPTRRACCRSARKWVSWPKKVRDGKLVPADMFRAPFTISSLGGIGGRFFTPIINAPDVAILGVCKSQMEPVWVPNVNGGQFVPRLMLPLSMT